MEQIKKYINEYNQRPSTYDKDIYIAQLGNWILNHTRNYKNKTDIMKNQEIYNIWTNFINDDKYKEYFVSNEYIWKNTLEHLKKYIDENNKIPSTHNKDTHIAQLGNWISTQQSNYKNKKNIMSNKEIYDIWTNFINDNKYKEYFISNEENWKNIFEQLKYHINIYNKKPSQIDKDENIAKLGRWITKQQIDYNNKNKSMKNKEIHDIWTEFINDPLYKKYFESNEAKWKNTFEQLKNYINDYNQRPSNMNKDKNIAQLGQWITHQQINYKNIEQIMANKEIYDIWTNFINDDKYKKYFLSNEENWKKIFEQVKCYINNYNKRPSSEDKNKNIKQLGQWISTQRQKYKNKKEIMQQKEIYDAWTVFINDPLYKKYFD